MEIRSAESPADFALVHALIAQMAPWDIALTEAAGYSSQVLLEAYYSDSAMDLHTQFIRPGAAMLLAHDSDRAIGCLGFKQFAEGTAEVTKFFVTDAARGKGTGRQLLDQVLSRMVAAGYARACLETVPFMTHAIALYNAVGFRPCPRFGEQQPELAGLCVFMDRAL